MTETPVAASGEWGSVEWAVDCDGRMPARDFYLKLPKEDQAKLMVLFRYVAAQGRLSNREKFRQLGDRAGPEDGASGSSSASKFVS
jgi:hypothetical protein